MITTLLASAIIAQASPATPAGQSSPTLTGRLNLVHHRLGRSGSECYGVGGFGDIRGELPVVIRDGDGKILAIGKTAVGRREGDVSCIFDFAVPDLPRAEFYQVQVGRRGSIALSRAALEKDNWVINLLLADRQ